LQELKDRRPYHEKLQSYRTKTTAVDIEQVKAVADHHGNPNADLLTTEYKLLDVADVDEEINDSD
jgi:hypothetical protein